MRLYVLISLLAGCVALCACVDAFDSGDTDLEESFGADDPNPQESTGDAENGANSGSTEGSQTSSNPGSFNLGSVGWLHTNVSGWPETASLRSVSIRGDQITLNYNKANSWPGVSHAGANVNANPWIFVNRGGRWYGATWEWFRVGQTSKSISSVRGNHIKKSPLSSFAPQSGETYGFMVSGLARDKKRNVQERSNVVMMRWP